MRTFGVPSRPALPATLTALLVALLAGCLSGTQDGEDGQDPGDGASGEPAARVVVADIDTGINPYHAEFRDDGPDAYVHPSAYIPGYPADVPALPITLDAANYTAAVLADCELWKGVEPGKLYWFPGTRIIAARTTDDLAGLQDADCVEDLPFGILDQGGHGTMTASRVAGASSSLCPECKVVAVQGFSGENMAWVAEQGWIDLQTNSWGDLPAGYVCGTGCPVTGGQDRDLALQAAASHAVFVAGGNGLAGFFGVSGHPAYFDNIAGPDGIVMVGGHDGGYYTPWTMTLPHVVADANMHPAAHSHSLDESPADQGGGTSGATPFVAGTFARALYEARLALGDHGVGVRDGSLVVPGAGATMPAQGPLADGRLTLAEAKAVLFHTAVARPVRDGRWDGPTCDTECMRGSVNTTSPAESNVGNVMYPTSRLLWTDVPPGSPVYYFVGYGQVGHVTLQHAIDVLLGKVPMPPRLVEDQFFGFDSTARAIFDTYPRQGR